MKIAYTYLSCHYDMPQMNNFGGACLSPLAALIKFSKYDIYRTIYRGTVDFLAITAAASLCSNDNHNFVPLKTPSMPSVSQDGFFFSSRTPTYHFIRRSCHLLCVLSRSERRSIKSVSNIRFPQPTVLLLLVLSMLPTFNFSPDGYFSFSDAIAIATNLNFFFYS